MGFKGVRNHFNAWQGRRLLSFICFYTPSVKQPIHLFFCSICKTGKVFHNIIVISILFFCVGWIPNQNNMLYDSTL